MAAAANEGGMRLSWASSPVLILSGICLRFRELHLGIALKAFSFVPFRMEIRPFKTALNRLDSKFGWSGYGRSMAQLSAAWEIIWHVRGGGSPEGTPARLANPARK